MKHFEHPLKHKPSELLWRMMLAFSVFLFVCGLVLSPWDTLLPGLAAIHRSPDVLDLRLLYHRRHGRYHAQCRTGDPGFPAAHPPAGTHLQRSEAWLPFSSWVDLRCSAKIW